MKLLKTQIKMDKDVEIQRESLFCHEHFSPIALFRLIDENNSGYIDGETLQTFAEAHNLDFNNSNYVVALFDKDGDGKLNYIEFSKSITPKNIVYL